MLPRWHDDWLCNCDKSGPLAAKSSPSGTACSKIEADDVEAAALETSSVISCDSDCDPHWLEEDRLECTPTELRQLDEEELETQEIQAAHIACLEVSSFPNWCDLLTADTACPDGGADANYSNSVSTIYRQRIRRRGSKSPDTVAHEVTTWRTEYLMNGVCHTIPACQKPTPPPPPPPPLSPEFLRLSASNGNNSNGDNRADFTVTNNCNTSANGKAVASGRSLLEIESAVDDTRNNSNQQQRYEMRGGHSVEICSKVDFPDPLTRDVSVTVEATHSNGCHRVVMLKGLTAKKRPDLGPKVKDCKLRMDQIVMTRPNVRADSWQKSITMSYDSDFQVGVGEERVRAL